MGQDAPLNVCLVHSPSAGQAHPSKEEIEGALARHGYRTTYRRIGEEGWPQCLEPPTELVVVAGGDGTVTAVALQLAGRGVPMAVLPTGTANNIASALGSIGDLDEVVRSLHGAPRSRIAVGLAHGPWGEKRFIEGVGFGLFARTMRDVDDARGDDTRALSRWARLREDVDVLRAHTRTQGACKAEVWLDDEHITGEYILLSVMSIPSMGPLLELAPEADIADDFFDVALVPADRREVLERHLAHRREDRQAPHGATVYRARRVAIRWHGRDVHVDDDVWPKERSDLRELEAPIEVTIEPPALFVQVIAPGLRKAK